VLLARKELPAGRRSGGGSVQADGARLDAAEAWFENNDPEGVAANGERDQSLLELGWSNFL
jgi:hypothetical protein